MTKGKSVAVFLVALLVGVSILLGGCAAKSGKSSVSSNSQKARVVVFLVKGAAFVQVNRQVAKAGAPEALDELLKGPTASDKQQGLSTAIPKGTKLNSYHLDNGTAKVDFSKELSNFGGGSATVQAIINQIDNTVVANDHTAKSVVISVAGRPADEALKP